jgi:putative ABC transport system permease protein
MTIDLIISGLVQGLILALVTYAVMIPFRLLNFPDLSAEGSYPLGGAVCASLLIADVNLALAILFSALIAGLSGVATGLINLKLKVNSLLAGIIVSTMIYSVNLRIMSKPNISLFKSANLFAQNNDISNIIILLVIIALITIPLALFLRTEIGLRLRAIGLNPEFASKNGVSIAKYTIFGLFLAGSYSGLAGSLIVQLQNYMDIGMGIGIVIHALAALMIGEKIIGNETLNKQLIAPLIGAIIYQQIQGIALSFGLAASDLKFFTGVIVLVVIAMHKKKEL